MSYYSVDLELIFGILMGSYMLFIIFWNLYWGKGLEKFVLCVKNWEKKKKICKKNNVNLEEGVNCVIIICFGGLLMYLFIKLWIKIDWLKD